MNKMLWLAMMLSVSVMDSGCNGQVETKPDKHYICVESNDRDDVLGDMKGSGEYIHGRLSRKDNGDIIESWKWENEELSKQKTIELGKWIFISCAVLKNNYYIMSPFVFLEKRDRNNIIVSKSTVEEAAKNWPIEKGWSATDISTSLNGEFVVAACIEKVAVKAEDFDWDRPRLRLAIVDANDLEIKWLEDIRFGRGENVTSVWGLSISDDGAYVAVANWYDNGALVYDVKSEKVLWRKKGYSMDKEISIRDISISPDSQYIYTGGTSGCVYKVELQTGKILETWWANEKGEPIYGYRINSVAVSPDGKYVAAGTAPMGIVYIWEAQTGKVVKKVTHSPSIAFSPSSKALATFDGRTINVWNIPEIKN